MTWGQPFAFILFIPLIAIVYLNYTRRQKILGSMQYSSVKNLRMKTSRVYFVEVPLFLKVLAAIFMILALARPQKANVTMKNNVEGIDIMIALDVSDSMLIEDMKPENRLESSKETIKNFIKGRVSDRIGLVVFSGESYTRVPLTLDYPLLLKSLREVTTTRNMKMGTAIGVALANSVARLKDSTAKSRVIIFLTDGENNSGTIDPETALDIAKGYGIKIYTIGMGKDGDAQLPVYIQTPDGRKIKQYQPMHSTVNTQLLTKMAEDTGGKFYRATTSNSLRGVFSDINRLEKSKIEVNKYTEYEELFQFFIEWAFIFLLISFVLGGSWLRRNP